MDSRKNMNAMPRFRYESSADRTIVSPAPGLGGPKAKADVADMGPNVVRGNGISTVGSGWGRADPFGTSISGAVRRRAVPKEAGNPAPLLLFSRGGNTYLMYSIGHLGQ